MVSFFCRTPNPWCTSIVTLDLECRPSSQKIKLCQRTRTNKSFACVYQNKNEIHTQTTYFVYVYMVRRYIGRRSAETCTCRTSHARVIRVFKLAYFETANPLDELEKVHRSAQAWPVRHDKFRKLSRLIYHMFSNNFRRCSNNIRAGGTELRRSVAPSSIFCGKKMQLCSWFFVLWRVHAKKMDRTLKQTQVVAAASTHVCSR